MKKPTPIIADQSKEINRKLPCPKCGSFEIIEGTSGRSRFDGEPWDDYRDWVHCFACGYTQDEGCCPAGHGEVEP